MAEKKANSDNEMIENIDFLLALDVLAEEENWDLAEELAEESDNSEFFEKMSEEDEDES